ncbi:MAG: DUF4126 domain-containing protein [Actinomycetota bacterium]
MDTVTGYFTALGLSTAAGLNAYIPLLAVGLFSRYTDLIDLPAPWDHLGDPLVLGLVAVVGVADFIGDKIPIVDPGFAAVLGVVAALATQVGRTAARPAATATTAGAANPVLSLGEDGASGALSVTSILWPVVAAVLAAIVLVALFVLWRKWRELGLRLQGRVRRDVP